MKGMMERRSMPPWIRWVSRYPLVPILVVILLLPALTATVAGGASWCVLQGENPDTRRSDDCTTIVLIVDGMMKSRSGAT